MGSLDWSPGWDGHLLLFFDEESQRRAGVAAWVRRGLQLGSKILCTEASDDPSASSLAPLLQDEPRVLEALERGQIELVPADDSAYDPAAMAAAVDTALAAGYPSVRWSGEATTAWGAIPPSRHRFVERTADQLCTSRPLSMLCQYPAGCREAVGTLSRAHAAGVREQLFQAAPVAGGLALAGELDVTSHGTLRSLLAATTAKAGDGELVLDLRWVQFLDLSAARALLFGTREHRDRGGRVRLREPQPHVAELLRLLGIDRMAGIDVVRDDPS